MAPSPMMMTGLPPQLGSSQPPQRRRRTMLEVQELAQLAAAPSSPLVEQIPAASPTPLFSTYAPSVAPGWDVSYEQEEKEQLPVIAPSVYEAISKNSQYSDLKQLVDKAGLASELGPNFSGTVFAPNNAAFDNLAKEGGPALSTLLNGPSSDLKKLLLFHVAATRYNDATLAPGTTISTQLPGSKVQAVLSRTGKGVDIKPASYAGKIVGPAGPGELFVFFIYFLVSKKRGRRYLDASTEKKTFSLFPSLSLSFATTNRRLCRQGRPLSHRRRARSRPRGHQSGCLK